MANNNPPNHAYLDALNKTGKNRSFKELNNLNELKEQDIAQTQADVDQYASIDDDIAINREQLALANYYNQMEEVTIDSGVMDLWKHQVDELKNIDVKTPKDEYMHAYEKWQNIIKEMDDERRNKLGLRNDRRYEEGRKKEAIQSAKEGEIDAKKAIRNISNEVDPFQALLGQITGVNRDYEKRREAHRKLRDAKRRLRDAKRDYEIFLEDGKKLEEKSYKLKAEELSCLRKMNNAKAKMAANKAKAARITDNVTDIGEKLQAQYTIIEQYKAIQALKKDPNYVAICQHLKATDMDLYKKLESIPDNLPSNSFTVTLEGLRIDSHSENIAQISEKYSQLFGKDLDSNNLEAAKTEITEKKEKTTEKINELEQERQFLEIKDGETLESVQEQMDNIQDKSSKEYKQLEAKKEHLFVQRQIEFAKKDIEKLKEEILNNVNPTQDNQKKLQELKYKQDRLKMLEEKSQNDEYSQMVNSVNKELSDSKETIAKLEELENLLNQHSQINGLEEKISDTTNALSATTLSTTQNSPERLSQFFLRKYQELTERRKQYLSQRNLPDHTNDGPNQNNNQHDDQSDNHNNNDRNHDDDDDQR